MNDLETATITSLEVAEMTGKIHKNLIRSISLSSILSRVRILNPRHMQMQVVRRTKVTTLPRKVASSLLIR